MPEAEYEPFGSFESALRLLPAATSGVSDPSGSIGLRDHFHKRLLTIGGAVVVALVALVVVILATGSHLVFGSPAASPQTSAARTASGLLSAGAKAQRAGQAAVAQSTYEAALKLQPKNAIIVYDLGTLAQQWGKTSAALDYYDQALVDDPTMTPAMFNKAILESPADRAESVALYQRIVSLRPNASTSYFNLGLLLETRTATRSQGLSDLAQAVYLNASLRSLVPAGLILPTVTPVGGHPRASATTPKY